MQQIKWDKNGNPVIGDPISEGTALAIPAM
jgi:hypothetical protein